MVQVADSLAPAIERFPPFGRLGPRKLLTLPLEQVRPVIHLAHRLPMLPVAPQRIIVDHEFVLTFGGRGRLHLGGGTIDFGPGELLYFPPFVPHHFERLRGESGEHLAVHFDWAPGAPRATADARSRQPYEVRLAGGLCIPTRTPLSPGHRIENEFRALIDGWRAGNPLGRFRAFAALTNMIGWALDRASRAAATAASSSSSAKDAAATRNRARVDRAIAYAQQHLADSISAESLAGIAGVSASRLTSLFRAATGYAPMEYVRRLRVEEAKRLLADLDLSVKEVAFRTGFADIYHFSHAFNRIVGLSATQYRQVLISAR
jgi:AraC-like DNA-binding protein